MALDSGSPATVSATSGVRGDLSSGCVHLVPESLPPTPALRIPAVLDSLDEVAEYVLRLGKQAALPASPLYRLRLAADELATNIVMHGYRGAPGHISVDGGVDPDEVWVRFEDDAPAFDPRQGMRAPALDVPLAERQIGGLGVYLAFTAVDCFAYELVAGRNVSTLVVNRRTTGQEATWHRRKC